MALSLGAVLGGPEQPPCFEAFRQVMRYFAGNKDRPSLNVVFHFPGRLMQPKYQGLRTGRFSSKDQGFMIQVAVPRDIAESSDHDKIIAYVCSSLKDALLMSEARWIKHGIPFPLQSDLQRVVRCRESLHAGV